MTAHSHASDLDRELTVVYADLPAQAPAEELSPFLDLTLCFGRGKFAMRQMNFVLSFIAK